MPSLLISFVEWGFLSTLGLMGLAMHLIDEPLHRLRGLSEIEVRSHVWDCLATTFCFGLGILALKFPPLFWAYVLSASLTCLLTFKDEIQVHNSCAPFERLIHALMFCLNGALFTLGAVMILLRLPSLYFELALLGSVLTMAWQIFYWRLFRT